MESGRDDREPRRMPPGEPGDDLRSDPIALSRTGRPYFRSEWHRGWVRPLWGWSALVILVVAVILVFAALA